VRNNVQNFALSLFRKILRKVETTQKGIYIRPSNLLVLVETLTFRRRTLRITQQRLAQIVGVSPRTIYALESGDTSVSVKTLFAVVVALDFRIVLERDPRKPADVVLRRLANANL